jgi:hypothetical protein
MSRERLNLIQKLLRLRRLDEEREAAQLRGKVRAHALACDEAEKADEAVKILGQWKSRVDPRLGLDLDRYRAALELETHALSAAETARKQQQDAKQALERVAERHGQAAAATRVSQSRHGRLDEQVRRDEEMKDSDRLADLRAATSGSRT